MRKRASVLCILLSLIPFSQAWPAEDEDLPALAAFDATVVAAGQSFTIPARVTAAGPLFTLAPLAQVMGTTVEPGAYGEATRIEVLQKEFVLGAGSPAVTSGEEIFGLSQPAVGSLNGLLVPLDLLDHVFGSQLGYRFSWDDSSRILSIEREETRLIDVRPELVRLQGATTLAFEFSERPRYRLEEQEGRILVEVRGDRLRRLGPQPARARLVESVSIEPQRIRVRLAPGAAAQSYVLQRPFRLVFDIFPEVAPAEKPSPDIAPPRRRSGVRTIVIDPGHGGAETGAIGPSGVQEKDLALSLARSLARSLEQRLAVRAVLTRETDEALPLEARTAIANQNKADLFISLHLNSAFGGKAHGAETYILNADASDRQAADTAAFENQAATVGGAGAQPEADPLYDLQLILWDMSQSYHLSESLRFASLVQEELNKALDLRDRGVKQAPFQVLMGAAMPAALVELGFLSNPAEEKKLQDPAYRSELVAALVRAVARYKAAVERTREQAEIPEGGRPKEPPPQPADGAVP